MAIEPGTPITQTEMSALESAANSKGSLLGKPYNFQNDGWLFELTRLRQNLAFVQPPISAYDSSTSGPWPVSTFDQPSTRLNGRPRNTCFYYAATGANGHFVTLNQNVRVQSTDPQYSHPNAQPPNNTVKTCTCKIIIGGIQSVRFRGKLSFLLTTTNNGNAAGSVTTDFPASFTLSQGFFAGLLETALLDITLAPGTYTFTCTAGADTTLNSPSLLSATSPNQQVVISTLAAPPEAWPGIHTTLNTFRINCAIPDGDGFPFGLFYFAVNTGRWDTTDTGYFYESSIAGLWTSRIQMISQMPNLQAWMPWNPLQTGGPGGVNNGRPTGDTPSELRNQPTNGAEITRSNNQAVTVGSYTSAIGFYHQALQTGTTGANPPAFSSTPGGTVVDGQITWRNIGTAKPVMARFFGMPRYPTWKDGDIGAFNPAARYQYWTNFTTHNDASQPYWFIYRVRLNRIVPETFSRPDDNAIAGENVDFPPINVELGCLTNGDFRSFGTWQTGDWVRIPSGGDPDTTPHLLWPIFRQHSLMYRAAERVDVQAELITIDLTTGPQVTYPILAAHFNDTLSLLNLIG